jgi:hypothetical protein
MEEESRRQDFYALDARRRAWVQAMDEVGIPADDLARAEAEWWTGTCACRLGDFDAAEAPLKRASDLARANGWMLLLARALFQRSRVAEHKGQLELAEDRLALLRRKYEGAKRPDELKSARPEPSRERSSEANGAKESDEIERAPVPERASSEAGAGS